MHIHICVGWLVHVIHSHYVYAEPRSKFLGGGGGVHLPYASYVSGTVHVLCSWWVFFVFSFKIHISPDTGVNNGHGLRKYVLVFDHSVMCTGCVIHRTLRRRLGA